MFSSLSTCRLANDRPIRDYISSIRYEFATITISKMIWIPVSANLADSGTKTGSYFSQSFQLLLIDGIIPFDYKEAVMQSSDQLTGCVFLNHERRTVNCAIANSNYSFGGPEL